LLPSSHLDTSIVEYSENFSRAALWTRPLKGAPLRALLTRLTLSKDSILHRKPNPGVSSSHDLIGTSGSITMTQMSFSTPRNGLGHYPTQPSGGEGGLSNGLGDEAFNPTQWVWGWGEGLGKGTQWQIYTINSSILDGVKGKKRVKEVKKWANYPTYYQNYYYNSLAASLAASLLASLLAFLLVSLWTSLFSFLLSYEANLMLDIELVERGLSQASFSLHIQASYSLRDEQEAQ